MKFYCRKKGRYLKKREVKDKFHCLRQNFKKGCVNLERRMADGEIAERNYQQALRVLRHKVGGSQRRERYINRSLPEMQT